MVAGLWCTWVDRIYISNEGVPLYFTGCAWKLLYLQNTRRLSERKQLHETGPTSSYWRTQNPFAEYSMKIRPQTHDACGAQLLHGRYLTSSESSDSYTIIPCQVNKLTYRSFLISGKISRSLCPKQSKTDDSQMKASVLFFSQRKKQFILIVLDTYRGESCEDASGQNSVVSEGTANLPAMTTDDTDPVTPFSINITRNFFLVAQTHQNSPTSSNLTEQSCTLTCKHLFNVANVMPTSPTDEHPRCFPQRPLTPPKNNNTALRMLPTSHVPSKTF